MATTGTDLARTNGGSVTHRQEFGATQLEVLRETAATAVAAREKAAVEARYSMALMRRRNVELARTDVLRACKNLEFAKAAWFKIPNKGEGFTIRFAEEALRAFGNVYPEVMTVYESEEIRMLRISVTDLESNITYSSEIIVQKTIERKELKPGQSPLAERVNSYGKKVFLIPATDDEVISKQNNLASKALRTNGLRLIPSWIKDEARDQIAATIRDNVSKDVEGNKRKIIDAFDELSIRVTDLEQYLGHKLERVSPAELVDLRSIYTAIKDGETSWDTVMESRKPSKEEEHGSAAAAQRVAEEKLAKEQPQTEPGAAETSSTDEARDPGDSNSGGTSVKSDAAPPAGNGETKPQGGFKFGKGGR